MTTEPPTLRSIPSFGVSSLRRSYSCYNCNYSFHITPTTNTSLAPPSSFRCPRCHHRHLIPHHTISLSPPSSALPTRDNDYSPAITSFEYQTSDDSDSDDDDDSDNSLLSFTFPNSHQFTPALTSFVDSLPLVKFPPNSTLSAQSCPICIEDFEVNSDTSGAVNELPCKHYFHKDCIVQWLQRSSTCPLCRHKLPSNRSPEKGINRGTTESEAGYDAILVVDFASVREPALSSTSGSGDGSLDSNVAVSGSDRRVLSAYGGELSGWELDAMHDEDGDTLMMDA
ncbi:E3 ubiquitin-protein ligase RING1-like [Salvia miltiorrhiza]|uniref:E3 ubiquitin-protein ligase RING1-like n=1 Tax=Salvia miltiorrhiza TaxID=226208 RepID=UPI0025ABEE8C|nr:E3 ubiquitin-protein ligase RING1-like [Salvia miltiorrhiza]